MYYIKNITYIRSSNHKDYKESFGCLGRKINPALYIHTHTHHTFQCITIYHWILCHALCFFTKCISWFGQKVCLGFSVTSFGKTQANVLANPRHTANKGEKESICVHPQCSHFYITSFTAEAPSPSVPGGLPLYTVDHAPQVQILAFSSLYPPEPSMAYSINIRSTQWVNYAPMHSFYTNFMMFCFS